MTKQVKWDEEFHLEMEEKFMQAAMEDENIAAERHCMMFDILRLKDIGMGRFGTKRNLTKAIEMCRALDEKYSKAGELLSWAWKVRKIDEAHVISQEMARVEFSDWLLPEFLSFLTEVEWVDV